MSAEGAFWLYDNEEDKWRYFLITSLFNRVGPRETYLRLNKALREKLSEHEIQEFSFYIADPNDGLVQAMRKHNRTTVHTSDPHEVTVKLNGKTTNAFIYRMTKGLSEDKVRLVRRRFNRLYNEVVTA
jgi:hypothetical protein|tara:strand:- start:243 stop:626 length:384 start_codon:yes stop_codon:yes gene_type:complete